MSVLAFGQFFVSVADFSYQRASLGALPDYSLLYEDAIRLHARKEYDHAKRKLDEAKIKAPRARGELFFTQKQSMSFDDVCDTDDLTGPHLVCSHPEALLDIPFAQLAEFEFFPGQGFQDMLWKPARLKTWSGDEAIVRV